MRASLALLGHHICSARVWRTETKQFMSFKCPSAQTPVARACSVLSCPTAFKEAEALGSWNSHSVPTCHDCALHLTRHMYRGKPKGGWVCQSKGMPFTRSALSAKF